MKSDLLSEVSDLVQLACDIYYDACARSDALSPDLRDLVTLRKRVSHEGLSFLTITLPTFARDLERGLEQGYVDTLLFRNFKKRGAIPAFLSGMLSLVFDRGTGRIIDHETLSIEFSIPDVLVSIRQICLAFKKIEVECEPERVRKTLREFVATESSFEQFSLQEKDRDYFNLVSSVLWDNMFSRLRLNDAVPKHGPGATADRVTGNQKFGWSRWHERLEPFFPFLGSGYHYSAFESKELEKVTFVSQDDEQPVRVITVPKTLKAPRVIAIEPCCQQYCQQGIRGLLYEAIESHWMHRGHVNFRDQSVNQSLAMISSSNGRLATIDLSEASDRVPLELVTHMLKGNLDMRDAILACRSEYAEMPDGTIIGPLKKFASMGSALCFPIEAMYFYTICVGSILKARRLPVTHRGAWLASRDVYVYGDDIIVPTEHASTVLEDLQKYNCKVNTNKTFVVGRFRESCGIDAYDGVDVTPVYVRSLAPKNRQQAAQLISWIDTARQLYKKGYWRSSERMFQHCERYLGDLPALPDGFGALGRVSYVEPLSRHNRYDEDVQCRKIRAYTPTPVRRTDVLGGHGALMKFFLRDHKDSDPFGFRSTELNHLEQSALHGAVALKRRWVPTHLWESTL